MTTDREVRTVSRGVEIRAETETTPKELSGYAALFDTPAEIAGSFVEIIDRGAFDQALGDDVRVLFNHDPNLVLGRTKSGTAALAVDATGLRYRVRPPTTQVGRDVVELVERGDIDGSSFGFRVLKDSWTEGVTPNALPVRHIEAVALYDVSPVTQPAYTETTVEARSTAADLTPTPPPAAPVVSHSDRAVDATFETHARRLRLAQRRIELNE